MNSKLILTTLAVGFMGLATHAHAQTAMKIGYADVDYIVSKMPELGGVTGELQALGQQLQNQQQSVMAEYQVKLQDYQQRASIMTADEKQSAEQDLTNRQRQIREFEQNAQNSLLKKRADMMKPLYAKVGSTIEAVAKENAYSHVLNGRVNGVDVVLYASNNFDVTDLVLKKMGVAVDAN